MPAMRAEFLSRLLRIVLYLVILAWGLASLPGPAGAVSVESIPTPRPQGWTVDLTGSLTAEDIQALNELCEEVNRKTGAEIAVVAVGTVDGADPRDFATRLFDHWQIGQHGANNGILLFTALDDRASEIVLGMGIDTAESRRLSEEIMGEEMLPLFRAGNVAGALHQGADASARRILGASLSGSEPSAEVSALQPSYPKPAPSTNFEAPVARDYGRSGPRFGPVGLLLVLVLIAGSVVLYFRLVPPRCRECRSRMVLLTESGDDLHLEPSEQSEERIGSVNYDVWLCNGCGQIRKRRWSSWFSGHSACPKCSARTRVRNSTVLEEATYSHGGQVRVDEACGHCDYQYSYTRSTPRLEESRRSSSSSISRGISSSSSSSSRSSSSSGFGGGKSSGGGASGRW